VRTSASEQPPISEKCSHSTIPLDCGHLLWTVPVQFNFLIVHTFCEIFTVCSKFTYVQYFV